MIALILDALGSYLLIKKTSRWFYLIPLAVLLGIVSSLSSNLAMHYIWPHLFTAGEAATRAVIGSLIHPFFCAFCMWWFRRKNLDAPANREAASSHRTQLQTAQPPETPKPRLGESISATLAGNMVSHPKLKRLAILVASANALGFGSLAGYAKYEAHIAHEEVQILSQIIRIASNECNNGTSSYCEIIDSRIKRFDESALFRDERNEDAKGYLGLALAIPFICALLLFGGNWVVTGKINF